MTLLLLLTGTGTPALTPNPTPTFAWPRTMPEVGAMAISFELSQVDYMSPETGGRIGAVAAGFPLWRARISLTNMKEKDSDIWRAFIPTCRGPRRAFLVYDIARQRPGVPGQTTTTWSQAINSDGDAVLTMATLLVGTTLKVGDYIGFRWDAAGSDVGAFDRRALVRVVYAGMADADGDLVVIVEPPVPTVVPSDAEVYFNKPSCLMRIVSAQLGEQVPGNYTVQGGVIEAVQELLP